MILKTLKLNNFRNVKEKEITFSDTTNVLYGNNGVGKTNIIEAIGYLGLCKSFRNCLDRTLINLDSDFFYIKGNIKDDKDDYFELETSYNGEIKKKKKNGIEILKVKDYIGSLKLVVFSAEDLNIIKGTPQYKRSFLDQTLSQISYQFLESAIVYKKYIANKNALLKNDVIDQTYLSTINHEIEKHMYIIQNMRLEFISYINENINEIYHLLSETTGEISIQYKSNVNQNTVLDKYFEMEKRKQISYFGTHRDDFTIKLNGQNIEDFGSQGQQRLVIICLKIMQLLFLKSKTNSTPLLLLDDVFSEIDKDKVMKILDFIANEDYQVIITTTEKIDNLKDDNINYIYIE